MMLLDVNVLVHAFRRDMPLHREFRGFVEDMVNGPAAYAMSDFVLSAVVRILTNRRIFNQPTTLANALALVHSVRNAENCVHIVPGPRHWEIFTGLCAHARAMGDLVPDAYFAALAIESGCEWITRDKDYTRFPGLRCRHPLE